MLVDSATTWEGTDIPKALHMDYGVKTQGSTSKRQEP